MFTGPAAADWSGIYVGVFGNVDIVDHDFVEGGGLGSANSDYTSGGGGVFAGFNRQHGMWVYGLEGQIGVDSHTETVTGVPGPGTMTSKVGVNGSVQARLGADMGRAMPFVSAGVAIAELDTFWPFGPAARSATLVGATVGAGVDVMVTENIFGRASYNFTYFGSEALEYCGGGCVMNHQVNTHSFKLGVGAKF